MDRNCDVIQLEDAVIAFGQLSDNLPLSYFTGPNEPSPCAVAHSGASDANIAKLCSKRNKLKIDNSLRRNVKETYLKEYSPSIPC